MNSHQRSSGILLPLFSLPSPFGIGTLGKAAYEFAEFLSGAGQTYWQMLPLGPTGFGDSPYQSFSSFAGNPYFIDPDQLTEDGLLTLDEINSFNWGDAPEKIDYKKIYDSRFELLSIAFRRGYERLHREIGAYVSENFVWLPDYALYMALKRHFGMRPWYEWEDADIRLYKPEAQGKYRELLSEDIDFFYFIQYIFHRQWLGLREHCIRLGIQIIGDLPIYASMDSSDIWSNAKLFCLDENNLPTEVAGVPPDYFSETGQLWGNPIYRWDEMQKNGFSWWRDRISSAANLFDVIRIDHFRGLESYWSVPYGSKSAETGKWKPGPGKAFLDMLKFSFPKTRFIAEDLGIITDGVTKLREYAEIPGMAVLSFAFHPDASSTYLPHNLDRNCALYTGTHDNDTLSGWLANAPPPEREFAELYCGGAEALELNIIRCGMASPANIFISQMQDWLKLGSEARINTPATTGDNWCWRLLPHEATPELQKQIYSLTRVYGRLKRVGSLEDKYAN